MALGEARETTRCSGWCCPMDEVEGEESMERPPPSRTTPSRALWMHRECSSSAALIGREASSRPRFTHAWIRARFTGA